MIEKFGKKFMLQTFFNENKCIPPVVAETTAGRKEAYYVQVR